VATDAWGSANYGRFELGASVHLGLTRALVLRGGISHAVVVTPGAVRDDLPFNKRLFLGGASSVRGYVEGEAASFDPSGKLVGDESYLLGQVELEQRLTSKLSFVGFLDVAGIARDIADYRRAKSSPRSVPESVGERHRPVRLEYSYNLRKRGRSVGSLLSVGYPF
jgi:outer membrane translocation and assembly module TamA